MRKELNCVYSSCGSCLERGSEVLDALALAPTMQKLSYCTIVIAVYFRGAQVNPNGGTRGIVQPSRALISKEALVNPFNPMIRWQRLETVGIPYP
jgi:hypothetical protein